MRAHGLCLVGAIVPNEHNSPVGPGAKMAFEITSKQGAALITNHPTFREDAEREYRFKAYTKKHYQSWVDFALEQGHGDDINPVLVDGVDLTKEFATIAFSDNQSRMECEFLVGAPAVGSVSLSVWGSWHTPDLIHTNCGPTSQKTKPLPSRSARKKKKKKKNQGTDQAHHKSGPTQGNIQGNQGADENSTSGSAIPEDHNQCVFIRYYTIRKRFFVPMVIKAGAGPHQLPKESTEEDDAGAAAVEISSGGDNNGDGGLAEISYQEAGPEVIHNVPQVSPGRTRTCHCL